jgi:hypothetical protein
VLLHKPAQQQKQQKQSCMTGSPVEQSSLAAPWSRPLPAATSADDVALMDELNILEVPTFIFMRSV